MRLRPTESGTPVDQAGPDVTPLPAVVPPVVVVLVTHDAGPWFEETLESLAAQTYADLFAQPGWQASEFRRALWRKHFDVDDWSQRDQG